MTDTKAFQTYNHHDHRDTYNPHDPYKRRNLRELLHWSWHDLPWEGRQYDHWENLPELDGPDTSPTRPHTPKLPTNVRGPIQTSTVSIHLPNILAPYLAVCLSVLSTVFNYLLYQHLFFSEAWAATTTVVIQMVSRSPGATPLTQRNVGSSARCPNVVGRFGQLNSQLRFYCFY